MLFNMMEQSAAKYLPRPMLVALEWPNNQNSSQQRDSERYAIRLYANLL